MGPAEIYTTCRTRLLGLAPTLSPEQGAAPLAPTPPWTVVDGYRHLTGVCEDMLAGNRPQGGITDTAWTANQLAVRADRSLEEVCAEWAERGPALDAMVEAAGAAMGFVALDAWTHEQDIRAASGVGAIHDDAVLPGLLALTIGNMDRFYAASGGPPLRLVLDGQEHRSGDGEPTATLVATSYELMRMVFGRRSQAQVDAADWSGEGADAARAAIRLFPAQPQDLTD